MRLREGEMSSGITVYGRGGQRGLDLSMIYSFTHGMRESNTV